MANPQHSSESNEHMTPQWVVDAARSTLGSIDLDPASSRAANRVIKAGKIYTARTNGFNRKWSGNVFLNPPGGVCDKDGRIVIREKRENDVLVRAGCKATGACGLPPGHKHKGLTSSALAWWRRLAAQRDQVRAIFVGFSLELLQASAKGDEPWPLDFPVCVPFQRLRFDQLSGRRRVAGDQPTHGNIIVLVGTPCAVFADQFRRHFSAHGRVSVPLGWGL